MQPRTRGLHIRAVDSARATPVDSDINDVPEIPVEERRYHMKARLHYLFVGIILTCILTLALAPLTAAAATQAEADFFKDIPVSGALADGGTFNGTATITQFDYQVDRSLVVSGLLHGTATTADGAVHENVEQPFTNIPTTLADQGAGSAQITAICEILDLDIGAIHLDLLGLVVDLAPVHLDITAVSGPGNLLGNLLCAIVGLLDPGGLLGDLLNLNLLLDLLRQINQIIG
jgi:hypothetical protein